jgi:hypothetical protein
LARANMGLNFVSGQYGCLFSRCRKYVINSLIHGHFHIGPCINLYLSSWYITCKTWTNSIHVYRTQKTKTEEQNQTENRAELRFSDRVSNYCSTNGTHRVTLCQNLIYIYNIVSCVIYHATV